MRFPIPRRRNGSGGLRIGAWKQSGFWRDDSGRQVAVRMVDISADALSFQLGFRARFSVAMTVFMMSEVLRHLPPGFVDAVVRCRRPNELGRQD